MPRPARLGRGLRIGHGPRVAAWTVLRGGSRHPYGGPMSRVGAVGDLDPEDGPFAVVDTGGGSTELVVGDLTADGVEVRAARSVDIGSVRITERCLAGDPPSPDEIGKARELARSVLEEAFAVV